MSDCEVLSVKIFKILLMLTELLFVHRCSVGKSASRDDEKYACSFGRSVLAKYLPRVALILSHSAHTC